MRRVGLVVALACALAALGLAPAAFAKGLWRATGALATARAQHTATLLPSGKVLVAGGQISDVSPTASAELYNPATGLWSAADAMDTARSFHTATLLNNGRVLVAGGRGVGGPTGSAELFNHAAGSGGAFSAAPPLAARSHHTATLLADGRVLVTGGYGTDGEPTASVQIFDPAGNGGAGAWTAAAPLPVARAQHTATRLINGKVLVTGGTTCFPDALVFPCLTAATVAFDPAANGGAGAWESAGDLLRARYDHVATLTSGKVLVAGGMDQTRQLRRSAELYDPAATPTWSEQTPMAALRTDFDGATLADGRFLVAGGGSGRTVDNGSAELWNPATRTWSSTGSLLTARHGHTLTLLSGPGCASRCGLVLLAGGARLMPSDYLRSAELYDPAAVPAIPATPVSTPPGVVRDLTASPLSTSRIRLTFSATGSPPAGSYVIGQSRRRISGVADFNRSTALCGGRCHFSPRAAGDGLALTAERLRARTTYFYALRAVKPDGSLAPLSNVASARTRSRRPGKVRSLRARALSATRILLTFRAPGAPPARRYVIKQARAPITSRRRFRRADSLCRKGTCRFKPKAERERLRFVVSRLRAGGRYCYALRPRYGRRLAPRSNNACARTRGR